MMVLQWTEEALFSASAMQTSEDQLNRRLDGTCRDEQDCAAGVQKAEEGSGAQNDLLPRQPSPPNIGARGQGETIQRQSGRTSMKRPLAVLSSSDGMSRAACLHQALSLPVIEKRQCFSRQRPGSFSQPELTYLDHRTALWLSERSVSGSPIVPQR